MQPSLHVATSRESTIGKKKWYKMKTPQFGQKRQAPKARLQGLATKRVFRESRKEVCRDNWATPQRSCAWRVRQARRGSQIKEGTGSAKPLWQPGTHWFQFVQPVRPPRKSLSLRRIERYVFLWVISAHEPI